jgi:hypothetical protein
VNKLELLFLFLFFEHLSSKQPKALPSSFIQPQMGLVVAALFETRAVLRRPKENSCE